MRRAAVGLAVALSAWHFSSFEIRHAPILWDTRYYLYFSSRLAMGDVPYRDFFENKTPLSIFAGAALYRLGHGLGTTPLAAIRTGFLVFAALAGLLLFELFRRLSAGRWSAAALALLVYCAFPLLGWLPSIGVLPKMLMAVCASLAACLLLEGRFFLAGVAGMLSFLDWQVGALALLGVLLGAAIHPRRRRAVPSVAAGALAAALPFVVYFQAAGGLRLALDQTIGTLFSRGAESAQRDTLSKLGHLMMTARAGCPGQQWIVFVSLLGMGVYLVWLWRWRRVGRMGTGLALAVYHYGVVAFSLFDFQSYGDLFILLHSVVFFAAVALVELARRLACLAGTRRRLLLAGVIAALALAARPSLLHSDFVLLPPNAKRQTTLEDQQEVSRRLQETEGAGKKAVVGPAEVLFLSETRNGVPFVYWNAVTWRYYRQRPRETYLNALSRLLEIHEADLLVLDRPVPPGPRDRVLAAADDAYGVTLRTVR